MIGTFAQVVTGLTMMMLPMTVGPYRPYVEARRKPNIFGACWRSWSSPPPTYGCALVERLPSDGLVLGSASSHGHPCQRHFGPALRNQSSGLGSYKSAWLLGAELRRAMVAPGRSPLAGLAEVDETEIPLRTKDDPVAGGGGRSHQGKMLVAGAVEVANGAPGRIRLAEITDFSAPSRHGFIAANVAPGITIRTDGWSGYPGAPDVAHDPHVIIYGEYLRFLVLTAATYGCVLVLSMLIAGPVLCTRSEKRGQ